MDYATNFPSEAGAKGNTRKSRGKVDLMSYCESSGFKVEMTAREVDGLIDYEAFVSTMKVKRSWAEARSKEYLSLIHISEPTRLALI
eukprot:3276041-Alexandrium_andersonii.AAC.1